VSKTAICLGQPDTLFVIVEMFDAPPHRLNGVEFRINGFPENWIVLGEPAGENPLVVGNPLGDRGNIAFPECYEASSGILVLRIIVCAKEEGEVTLRVEMGRPPSNPWYTTPVADLCDPPYYTAVALLAGTMQLRALECAV
jgi:hypothetical protein